jgi:hypothetical protein
MAQGEPAFAELVQSFMKQEGAKVDHIERQRDGLRNSIRSLSCDLAIFCRGRGCDKERTKQVADRFFSSLYRNLLSYGDSFGESLELVATINHGVDSIWPK